MEIHLTLMTLGGLFIIGLAADEIGRRTWLPRVTLLMMLGVLAGPVGFDFLPPQVSDWYELLASVALTMVAFLLGGSLSRSQLRRHGRQILTMSLVVVTTTIIVVGGGLIVLGVAPATALLLSGIATATAPATTLDVIRQTGAKGEFAQTLEGIVAIDDAWGLIAFSLMLIGANVLVGNAVLTALQQGLWELFGAIAVGAIIGFPAAFLTGRLRPGEPMQAEALGVVFLCAGVAVWLEVSFLIAGIVAGMIVVNLAKHHTRAFHEIEHIEWPFMILFFFLAGASLHTDRWWEFGLIAGAFLVLRTISRIAGGWVGGKLGAAPDNHRRWMGVALLPQAGVAVGMALVAGDHFPDLREVILTVTIGTTVVFEIFGPIATRVALDKAEKSEGPLP
jgi:Kef-type K+ transport system membrane component KefB